MSTTYNNHSYVLFVKDQKNKIWKPLHKFLLCNMPDNRLVGQYIRSNLYQEKIKNKNESIEFLLFSFNGEPQIMEVVNILNTTNYIIKDMIEYFGYITDIWHFHIGPVSDKHSDSWIESSAKCRSDAKLRFRLRLMRERTIVNSTNVSCQETEECKMPESEYSNDSDLEAEISDLREKIDESSTLDADNLKQLLEELKRLETPWNYYYIISTPEMVITFQNHT